MAILQKIAVLVVLVGGLVACGGGSNTASGIAPPAQISAIE